MAREIVITSVPRGVRPGRTGFQIAMQTAGLREDVCDQLESLGIYRHLPPGGGPNPVCYFHRFVQTGIGPLQVLGRVADAGADYSSRSNKLAHLIAIEAAELAGLRHSSPAAVLSAVEGRLARTWPGGPEERQQPFGLAGMPAVGPRICSAWQQSTGDAGWGGVLAEQAVKNKPVLVIAPDSSPEWCLRLLNLFAEALALVPEERRWGVTFDTTILSTAPVLWRGTYAGSPESGARQPGLTVVDLAQRSPVPAEWAGLPLVQVSRSGAPAPTRGGTRVPGVPALPGARGEKGPPIPPSIDDGPITVPATTSGVPPVPGRGGRKVRSGAESEPSNDWQAKVAWVVVAVIFLIAVSIGTFFGFDVPGRYKEKRARKIINAWADQADGKKPEGSDDPTIDTWLTAFGEMKPKANADPSTGLTRNAVQSVLPLLNSALLTATVTWDTIDTAKKVSGLISRLQALRTGQLDAAGLAAIGLVPQGVDQSATGLSVQWVNELVRAGQLKGNEANLISEFQRRVDALRPLAALVAHPKKAVPEGSRGLQSALEFVVIDSSQRERIAELAKAIADKPALLSEAKTVANLQEKLAAIPAPAPRGAAGSQLNPAGPNGEGQTDPASDREGRSDPSEEKKTEEKKNNQSAWDELVKQAKSASAASESREWPEPGTSVPLVSNIPKVDDLDWKGIKIILGEVENAWQPKAVLLSGGTNSEKGWSLTGQPGGGAEKTWGKIVVCDEDGQPGKKKLVFIADKDAPYICGFVPITFEWSAAPAESRRTDRLQVAKRPQALAWKTRGAKTWSELAGMAAGDPADAGAGQAPPATPGEGILEIQLEPWIAACSPQLVVRATNPASQSVELTLRHDKPGRTIDSLFQRAVGTVDLVFRSQKHDLKDHPLVERFRWEVSGKGTNEQLSVKPVDLTRREKLALIEVTSSQVKSMKGSRWCDIVREVLTLHLNEEIMKKLFTDEVGKRIGTKEINRLADTDWELRTNEITISNLTDKIKKKDIDPQMRQKWEHDKEDLSEKTSRLENKLKDLSNEVTKFSPWARLPVTKEKPLAEWKRMAVDYVADPGRRFARPAAAQGKPAGEQGAEIRRMALDPACVVRFLETEANWVNTVKESFLDPSMPSKAEQNELIALLVLANLDKMIVAKTDPEGVRQAFAVPISECFRATLEVTWAIEGEDPLRVPVATVSAAQKQP
jgi:hypothetical protein